MAEKIVNEYDFDWTENPRGKEVCITSVEMFCANVLNVALVFLLVLVLGVWKEALVFFVTFGLLRLYGGGGHAKNYMQCVTIYTVVLMASIAGAKIGRNLPVECLYAVMMTGMLFSVGINRKYAGKQCNIGSAQNKFRKGSLVILAFVECEMLIMGTLIAYMEQGSVRGIMMEFMFLQIFAVITQSIALYAGKKECISD